MLAPLRVAGGRLVHHCRDLVDHLCIAALIGKGVQVVVQPEADGGAGGVFHRQQQVGIGEEVWPVLRPLRVVLVVPGLETAVVVTSGQLLEAAATKFPAIAAGVVTVAQGRATAVGEVGDGLEITAGHRLAIGFQAARSGLVAVLAGLFRVAFEVAEVLRQRAGVVDEVLFHHQAFAGFLPDLGEEMRPTQRRVQFVEIQMGVELVGDCLQVALAL